jgi:drug/metabolite transporter (DMT)-like permease
MRTKKWAIGLVMFFTLITSVAQIFFKMAAQRLELTPLGILMNWPLILGFFLYMIAAALMLLALRNGELSVLYPLIALSYVWVSLLSPHFFPTDSMNMTKWSGVLFIGIGVSLIGVGSQK